MSREVMQQALEALEYYQRRRLEWGYSDEAAIAALRGALAEQPAAQSLGVTDRKALDNAMFKQPAAPVPTSFEDWWFKESTLDALEKNLTVEQECRLAWDAAIAAAIPPGCVVVKDEPAARMLTWRGPSHTATPPRAARTYAEFPEDAALPANKEAYWENAEPLYAARPGGQG